MTTAVSSAAFPITSIISMAKTPFIRTNSSSFEDEEEAGSCEENNDCKSSEQNAGVSGVSSGETTGAQVQPATETIQESKIQITKKTLQPPQANSISVVNKMSQSVYADHHNQCPPKGT